MAIKKTTCVNHPDRPAIGVCVITHKPICAECSTQYEGVNYSREGLAILLERRALAARKTGRGSRLVELTAASLSPLFLYLIYTFYHYGFNILIDLFE